MSDKIQLAKGITLWRNAHRQTIFRLHYEADPRKGDGKKVFVPEINMFLSPWAHDEYVQSTDKSYYLQEYEIDFGATAGALLFSFAEDATVVDDFPIPHNWTRYQMLDPHPAKPHAALWAAVDPYGEWWCVTPDTKILTADLRHVPAGEIKVGDELAGFDEFPRTGNGHRHWQKSIVQEAALIKKRCVRITLDDGTQVVCSEDHQWLSRSLHGKDNDWRRASDLCAGRNRLIRLTDVWGTDETQGAGYLAAAFDGEGSYGANNKGTARMNFTQRPNPMLAKVEELLKERNFPYVCYDRKNNTNALSIIRKREIMRFLGSVRPVRLLPKFTFDELHGCKGFACPLIVSIEPAGEQWVVAMKTSTRTYIAEGLASHNCYREYWPSPLCFRYLPSGEKAGSSAAVTDREGPIGIKQYVACLKLLESADNPQNGGNKEYIYKRVIDYAARAFGQGDSNQQTDTNFQKEFEKAGEEMEFPLDFEDAKKDRDVGVLAVNTALMPRMILDPRAGDEPVRRSKIRILRQACPELIFQLKHNRKRKPTQHEQDNEDPLVKAIRKRNDLTDCLRYFVQSNPEYYDPPDPESENTFIPSSPIGGY